MRSQQKHKYRASINKYNHSQASSKLIAGRHGRPGLFVGETLLPSRLQLK